MRNALSALGVALLTACQTYQIGHDVAGSAVRLAEMRARAAQSSALVMRVDRTKWESGMILHADTDSVRWQDELGRSYALHRSEVEAVRFDRRRAALLSWSAVGLSAGALIGASVGDDDEWWKVPELYIGAGAGGLAGAVLGLEYGLPITYRFR